MTPIEWAIRPLKKYADFSGRAPRAEYWWFYLATIIAGLVLDLIDGAFGGTGILSGIFNLAILIPWLAVSVRRLHDINRSGWWLMVFFVPLAIFAVALASYGTEWLSAPVILSGVAMLAAGITLFVFTILPGTEGPNRYGADPYGPDRLEEVFA